MKDSKRSRSAEYSVKYAREHLKRVPLDLRKEAYDNVRKHAEEAGMGVNTYIKAALAAYMGEPLMPDEPV